MIPSCGGNFKCFQLEFWQKIQNSCYLCNAFGAHALLAKLTMVTSSEKKAEFGLCTKKHLAGISKVFNSNFGGKFKLFQSKFWR